MFALSIHQPWASAIIHGGKDLENRGWAPPSHRIGKWLLIHATGTVDYEAFSPVEELWAGIPSASNIPKSALLGMVQLTGYSHLEDLPIPRSPWSAGPICWQFGEVKAFAQPIICPGSRGVWRLPDGLRERVLSTLRGKFTPERVTAQKPLFAPGELEAVDRVECAFCEEKAYFYCDYVLSSTRGFEVVHTCDLGMCSRHAKRVGHISFRRRGGKRGGDSIDYCALHAGAYPRPGDGEALSSSDLKDQRSQLKEKALRWREGT